MSSLTYEIDTCRVYCSENNINLNLQKKTRLIRSLLILIGLNYARKQIRK